MTSDDHGPDDPFEEPDGSDGPSSPDSTPETTGDEATETPAAPPVERTPLTQQLGRVVVVLLAVLFGVFAVANSHYVTFSWVFGRTEVLTDAGGERRAGGVPLIVLLLASFVIGVLLGAFVTWQARRARARGERRETRRGGS